MRALLCVLVLVRGAWCTMVPYTLGDTTIMVDSAVLGYNSPLLAHLNQGMPFRRESGVVSGSHAGDVKVGSSQSHEVDEAPELTSASGAFWPHHHKDSHEQFSNSDFLAGHDGMLDISVLPQRQAVFPSRPPPVTLEGLGDATGIYLQEEDLPQRPHANTPPFYYSVKTPDITQVSEKIHHIVTSLNNKTVGGKLNDRAPIDDIYFPSQMPPIPSDVRLDSFPEYPIQPPGRLGNHQSAITNKEGFTGVIHMVPKEPGHHDAFPAILGDYNPALSSDPLPFPPIPGGDLPRTPYDQDQTINDPQQVSDFSDLWVSEDDRQTPYLHTLDSGGGSRVNQGQESASGSDHGTRESAESHLLADNEKPAFVVDLTAAEETVHVANDPEIAGQVEAFAHSNIPQETVTISTDQQETDTESTALYERVTEPVRHDNITDSTDDQVTVTDSNNRQETTTDSSNRQETTTDSNNRQETTTDSSNRQETTTDSNNRQETNTDSNNRQETTNDPNKRQETISDSDNRQETVTDSNNRQEATIESNNRQETVTDSNNLQETTTDSNHRQETVTDSNNRQGTTTDSNNRQETTTDSNDRQETTTDLNNRQETTTDSNNRQQTTTDSSNRQETLNDSNTTVGGDQVVPEDPMMSPVGDGEEGIPGVTQAITTEDTLNIALEEVLIQKVEELKQGEKEEMLQGAVEEKDQLALNQVMADLFDNLFDSETDTQNKQTHTDVDYDLEEMRTEQDDSQIIVKTSTIIPEEHMDESEHTLSQSDGVDVISGQGENEQDIPSLTYFQDHEEDGVGRPGNVEGVALSSTVESEGGDELHTHSTDENESSPTPQNNPSILTDFPPTREGPDAADTHSEESEDGPVHYSPGLLVPYLITQEQASDTYVDDESTYLSRHEPPRPDDDGLNTWFDEDPISIFDSLYADKLKPRPFLEPEENIRVSQGTSGSGMSQVNLGSKPVIRVPQLRPQLAPASQSSGSVPPLPQPAPGVPSSGSPPPLPQPAPGVPSSGPLPPLPQPAPGVPPSGSLPPLPQPAPGVPSSGSLPPLPQPAPGVPSSGPLPPLPQPAPRVPSSGSPPLPQPAPGVPSSGSLPPLPQPAPGVPSSGSPPLFPVRRVASTPRPDENDVSVSRPQIPGYVPPPGHHRDSQGENATLSEEQESSDNTTTIFQGAVFHSATPSLLRKSSCKCGIRLSSKIVGGQPVTINQYPWNVALLNTITGLAFCGGAIINDLYIITAAHCVNTISVDKLLVRVGETSRQGQSTLQVPVQSIIVHPNYSGITSDDIALVKLARPLEYNEKILPVCLARGREDINNEKAIVTGWGRKTFEGALLDELHEVKIKVLPTRKCRRKSEYNFSEVHKKIICALGPGKDACQGDSGGPLTYLDGDQYVHIGIVSWGIGCANPDYPGIYTRISSYKKWIQENAVGGQTCQRSFFKQRSGNKNRGNKNKSKGTAGIRDAGESTKEEGNEGGGEVEEEGKVEEEEEMKEEEEGGFDTSVLDSILGSSSEDPAAVPTFTDIHKVLDPDNEDDGERENNKRRRNKNKRKKNKRKQNKDAMNGGDGNIADDEEEENENNDMNQYEDMGGVEEEGEEESDNKNKQNKNSGNRRRNNNKKGNKRNGNKKRNKNQNGEDEECNEDASNSTKQKVNKDNRRKTNQNKGNEESEDEVNIANVGGEDVEDEVDWSNLSEALKGIAYIIKKESEVTQSNPDENVGL
ncbi:uncharacterized protein LOC121873847 isoform X2 [Homarus americanus]|uniref:uncharacterized protein LOC121873847 isoform X2 n=1 Tax=Homarus americanus TaxID=6706 RepID=UPI001C447640|nr:uncharacterized protein LOC121873847 isoform X2 [Homarus americanus]